MENGPEGKLGKLTNFWSRYGLQVVLIAVLALAALSFLTLGLLKMAGPPPQQLPLVVTKVSEPIQAPPDESEPRLPQPLPALIQPTQGDEAPTTETSDDGQVRLRGKVAHPGPAQTQPEAASKPAASPAPSNETTPPPTETTPTAPAPTPAAAEPTSRPVADKAPEATASTTAPGEETAADSEPARLKPARAQDPAVANTKLQPAASATSDTKTPAPDTATATAAPAPDTATTAPATDAVATQEPSQPPQPVLAQSQAPALDTPPTVVPREATASTAPQATASGTGPTQTSPQADGDHLKVPKPRWQTVDENWDKVKLADMGPDTMDASNGAWKQIDVGETDQVAAGETGGQDIPKAPLMKTGPDQAAPDTATATATAAAATKTGKTPQTKTASGKAVKTSPTKTASKSSTTKTSGTGRTAAAPRPGVTLSIINETGQPGQGEVYRDVLQAMGYRVQTVVNRPPQSGPTTIIYGAGLKDKAQALARRIPGQRTLVPQTTPSSPDILVVIR